MTKAWRSILAKSTFIWIIGLLVAANGLWGFLRPLQLVPHTSQPNLELSKAALRFKMSELEKTGNPDILIIGSSLPMCAFFYTEGPGYFDLNKGAEIRGQKLNLLQSYPKAGYFTAKLKELSGKELQIFNFAGAACMVSDLKLVLSRTLAYRKKPKLVVYGVGLRDFVDNINPPPGETPYYKALCDLPFVLKHIGELKTFPSFRELSLGALFSLYDLRNEFRISAEHFACKTLHHPTSIEIAFSLADLNKQLKTRPTETSNSKNSGSQLATQPPGMPAPPLRSNLVSTNQKSAPSPLARKEKSPPCHLATLDYRQRYSPANYKQLEAEMQELKTLLAQLHKEEIQIVLINMPVSRNHAALSPPGLREKYLTELRKLASTADLFIDYEGKSYPDEDYFDTVHLNGYGAVKFVDDLSRKLVSAKLVDSLPQKRKR